MFPEARGHKIITQWFIAKRQALSAISSDAIMHELITRDGARRFVSVVWYLTLRSVLATGNGRVEDRISALR